MRATPRPSILRGVTLVRCTAAVLVAAGGLGHDAFAAEGPSPAEPVKESPGDYDALYERIRGAVVQVEAERGFAKNLGTGFFIDGEGTLVTTFSAVFKAEKVAVIVGGKKYPAKILLADGRTRLAIIRAKDATETPFLEKAVGETLKVADPLIMVPGTANCPKPYVAGMLSGFEKNYNNYFLPATHLRVNLQATPGCGGAPLLTAGGKVAGVLIYSIEEGKAIYALPIKAVDKLLDDFERSGEARHAWLGVQLEPHTTTPEVVEVVEGSPADKGGMKVGDVLLQLGDFPIGQTTDMLDACFYLRDGEKVAVSVLRDSDKLSLEIVPGVAMKPALHKIIPAKPAIAGDPEKRDAEE